MSESPKSYPDRAIRRVALSAALVLLAGVVASTYLVGGVPDVVVSLAAGCFLASYLVGIVAIVPMARAEKAEQENQEELDV